MANNHRRRRDYSNLLKEMQKKSKIKQGEDSVEEPNSVTVSDAQPMNRYSKDVDNIEYNLDTLIDSIKNLFELISLYDMCNSQIEWEQQITQDLLHAIEFSNDYKKRCSYSTQLHYNRERRRQYKNTATILKPIVEYIKKEDSKKVLDKLLNILCEARKTKSHINERTYNPRILSEIGVIKNGNTGD